MNDTNVAVIRLMALCDEYSKKGGRERLMTNVYLVTKLILSIVIIGNCIMFGLYLEVRDKLRELRSLEETVISKLRLMEDEKKRRKKNANND